MRKRKARIYGLTDFFNGYMDQIGQMTLVNLLFCVPTVIFTGMIFLISSIIPINIFVVMLMIPLLSPFSAGLFYAAKRVTLREELKALRDFKKGISMEWKPFLINSLIVYVITCGIYVTMQIYRGGLSNPILLTAFIMSMVFVLFFVCFENSFLTMLVTVDIKVSEAVKNAVLMFIGGIFYHLKVILSLALVIFLMFSVVMIIGDYLVAGLTLMIPFLLFVPVLCAYIIVYNIFQTVEKIIVIPFTEEKTQSGSEGKNAEDKPEPDREELEKLSKGDPEEYVFVSGRMLKRKTILKMLEE